MLLHQHLELLERDRSFALRSAIRAAVNQGTRVLDAGTGTGVLAIWAAQAGASYVLGVDRGHNALAEELVRANGYTDRIQLMQGDLREFVPAAADKFDLLIALVYDNDPRRDVEQSQLVFDLQERFLSPRAERIPDRVRYRGFALAWPQQDIACHRRETAERVARLSDLHGTDFTPIARQLEASPARALFPARRPDGRLERCGSRYLSDSHTLCEIDYAGARTGLPDSISFEMCEPGIFTSVLWVQELWFRNALLFRNESVSWLEHAPAVRPGDHVRLHLDERWRTTNVFAAEFCSSVGD